MDAPAILSRDPLTIYLNDHLAGASAGADLAARTAAENEDTDFGEPLRRLSEEIERDREELVSIVEELGIPVDRVKLAVGWSAEKLARLKPNGRIVGYSPLSRLLELEGLAAGIRGKHALWRALGAMTPPPVVAARLEELAVRAEEQLQEVEQLHDRAAQVALVAHGAV